MEPLKTDPRIFEALRAKASDESGFIELPDFVETALYQPELGYYRRDTQRVGRNRQSDFFTSTSLREAFAAIILEAATDLLAKSGLDAAETTWVEIGSEPGSGLLNNLETPFRSHLEIRPGNRLEIPEQAIVFSNELFDAQPFRQIRKESAGWAEYGVRLEDDSLSWAPRNELSEIARSMSEQVDRDCPTGYTIDLPTGAEKLAREISQQNWSGVFIAFDYGKTWHSLVHDTPQGSARGYSRHRQITDIFENPGQIDITHHICWDHLETALEQNGFSHAILQSQESFIIRRAPRFLQTAFDPTRSSLDPIRSKLRELIHPALMGQKFQALSAIRPSSPRT